MTAPVHPIPNDFGYVPIPLSAHHLAPEVMREAMHAVIKRPPLSQRTVSVTFNNPASTTQLVDLSSAVGKRRCWMAALTFRLVNLAGTASNWSVTVQPYQTQTESDVLVAGGEARSMANTFRRKHDMPIGDDGKITINFALGVGSTDDILCEVTVAWFATTVQVRSVPVPP